MTITGKIIDKDSNAPVPSATVELWTGNVILNRGIASSTGVFSLSTQSTPDKVRVSSAGYVTKDFAAADVTKQMLLPLEKNVVEGEGVFVTATIKKSFPWWVWVALAGVTIYAVNKK